MGLKPKANIIILVILLILSLAGAGLGFYSFQQERIKVFALNEELADLKIKRRIAETKLAESTKVIEDLNRRLNASQRDIQRLSSELERERGNKNSLDSQIKNLQSQLKEQEKIRNELETARIQAQKRIEELEVQLGRYKPKKEVALGKIIVGEKKPAGKGIPYAPLISPASEGRVLTINKNYGFAVMNLGSQNGLRSGDTFSLYKQDSYIGDIQVERVQESMSAFGFVTGEIGYRIAAGDEITLGRVATEQEPAVEGPVAQVLETPVEAAKPSEAASALQGNILVVNKEYEFAVINLGSQNGVNIGDMFSVYHNDNYIGDVKIDKTREIISTCVFLSNGVKDAIGEGDRVIRK